MAEKLEATLARCPFCGGAAKFIAKRPYCGVCCNECMSRGQLAGTREHAAELWNRRTMAERGKVPDVAISAELDRAIAKFPTSLAGAIPARSLNLE